MPNPGSPLSLETWYMDLENWLCDNTTLLRGNSNFMPNSPKMANFNNVHVNIPSPSSSGPAAAESPTLYDSPPGKGFVGPPPYVQIKQEIDDGAEYQCSGARMANNGNSTLMTIKREDDGLSSEKMEQLRNMVVEEAAKDIHVTCGILGISAGKYSFEFTDLQNSNFYFPIYTVFK